MADQLPTKGQRLRSLFHRQEAQAGFQFMLALPFFIAFFLLVVDFGITMYEYVSVSNAVREGARYAAVNCRPTAVPPGACSQQFVRDLTIKRSGGILPPSTTDCTVWTPQNQEVCVGWTGVNRGDSVVVKVDHPYQFLFVPGVSIHVVSCADMSLEQKDNGTGLLIDSGNRC